MIKAPPSSTRSSVVGVGDCQNWRNIKLSRWWEVRLEISIGGPGRTRQNTRIYLAGCLRLFVCISNSLAAIERPSTSFWVQISSPDLGSLDQASDHAIKHFLGRTPKSQQKTLRSASKLAHSQKANKCPKCYAS